LSKIRRGVFHSIAERTFEMTTIVQKEWYLRQATRCYVIAASVTGERAASMVRLGDTYSALAEDADAVEPPAIYVERQ
jgi:hypothetical protein